MIKGFESQIKVLELFNSIVVEKKSDLNTSLLSSYGVVTNFKPNTDSLLAISRHFKPIKISTLFGRHERDTSSLEDLLIKQVLHYVEVYGMNMPGLFDLEVESGVIVPVKYVSGITIDELNSKVQNLIYANAPIQNVELVKAIITFFGVSYDFNKIQNNELRIALYDEKKHAFINGDDAVRYMCYMATGNTMLIKSKEVLSELKNKSDIFGDLFFQRNIVSLSKVFNRHKNIILSVKNSKNKTHINRIARFSKTMHVPMPESINKVFLSKALKNQAGTKELERISIRDKFKILNLIEYKNTGSFIDAFIIRNGKVHIENDRYIRDKEKLNIIKLMILDSLKDDLRSLKNKKIILDKNVDYGLPISRKQTIGNLPFGTEIRTNSSKISSGVYWENEWGARDLDLSTIDLKGERIGWGTGRSYDSKEITFSGDLTDATNGAMEFMISENSKYGLFVNIYSGENGAKCELVVGNDGKDRYTWITDTIIREKVTLNSRGNILGFVNKNSFIVYNVRLNNNAISGDEKTRAILAKAKSNFWTIRKLFDHLDIRYSLDTDDNVVYDHDLRYTGFSFDKLENLIV